ncbi:3-oxoadipate enol-lactonase [Thioclava sp. FR2]|uniref:3-oxoadipate enol-lactonase n=1 Tax=Thioclava sp. FR2 TaxID=3445780 RepID=UPI003EB7061F
MPLTYFPDLRLNAEISGPVSGPPVVFLHALGTNLRIWDEVVAHLPKHRVLRLDMRGHGASDVPDGPYSMGALIHDAERMIEKAGMKETVVVGLSIGGLIAQGLATKRLDLVRGMVLSNTAARIGIASQWQARIEAVQTGGLTAIEDSTMERWFGRKWRENPAMPALREIFRGTEAEGWMGAAAAIAGTDFYTPTASLTLPTLALAGGNDGSTPPDLIRETADLIRGSQFHLIRGAGHIPMAEKPDEYIEILKTFLKGIGHG